MQHIISCIEHEQVRILIHNQGISTNVYLFADDTKIMRTVNNENYNNILQNEINNFFSWSADWLLKHDEFDGLKQL